MTDAYQRKEIDGQTYVLVPETDWADGASEVDEMPAWWNYIITDENKVNTDVGLFTNILLPLGAIFRTDGEGINGEQLADNLSRIIRSALVYVWDTEDNWTPDIVEDLSEWTPSPDIILVSLARVLTDTDEDKFNVRLKEIASEAATWLQRILIIAEEVEDGEEAEEAAE